MAKGRKTRNQSIGLRTGFTLVELMIVVAILGILAAIVIPEFQGHIQMSKESAAKDTLRLYRSTVERYAMDHGDVAPGYPDDDSTQTPSPMAFGIQLHSSTQYLSAPCENPFNGFSGMTMLTNGVDFPAEANGTSGWYYKPQTKEVRLNWPGVDSEGVPYYSY